MNVPVAIFTSLSAAHVQQDTATTGSGLFMPFQGAVRGVGSGLSSWIESVTGLGPGTQGKILLSLMTVVLIYLLRALILRLVERRADDPRVLYQWSKTSSYMAGIISFLVMGLIWVEGVRSMGTFLGLLTAGVAIALKDIVASFAGWVFILWRRPFQLGDRIQIGERAGDVVDIRIFQFTILEIGNWVDAEQSTGRVIHIPNAAVFMEPLCNYTSQFEFIWNEIPVLLTFESDWKRAKKILREIVDEQTGDVVSEARMAMKTASRKFLLHFPNLTPIVYTAVKDSGVLLTLRFICNPRHRRGLDEAVWEAVLDAFAQEPNIEFAYPTYRMYQLPEGEPGVPEPPS